MKHSKHRNSIVLAQYGILPVLMIMAVYGSGCSRGNDNGMMVKGEGGIGFAHQAIAMSVYNFSQDEYENPDTIAITDDQGNFTAAITLPHYSMVKIIAHGMKEWILGIENGKVITMRRNNDSWIVNGSDVSDDIRVFRRELKRLNAFYFDTLVQKGSAALRAVDTAALRMLEGTSREHMIAFRNDVEHAIRQLKTPVGIYDALRFLDDIQHRNFLEEMNKRLQREYSDLPLSASIERRVKAVASVSIGSPVPQFIAVGLHGGIVRPSDYRGKMILIDFWFSSCLPCRIDNPKLLSVYNRLPRDKFEIIGISIDEDRETWMRTIQSDELRWIHVLDSAKTISKTFRIRSYPQNILVDTAGIIIGRNMQPHEILKETTKRM